MELFDGESWTKGESKKMEKKPHYYHKMYHPRVIYFSFLFLLFPHQYEIILNIILELLERREK